MLNEKIEVVNGKEYHCKRMENGAWDIVEDMTEEEWKEFCEFLTNRMRGGAKP